MMRFARFKYTAVIVSILFISIFALDRVACSGAASYKVVEVVDGDTVRLDNGRSVRYIGIDTPETRKRVGREWVYAPEPLAVEATELNRRLVAGEKVELEFDHRKEDKYGRWLCYVYNDGKMVNEEMLRSGNAIFNVYPPNNKYIDRLIAVQAEAKKERRGLWADCPVISDREAGMHVGKVAIVRGRVAEIGLGKSTVYLNFEKGNSQDFTAVIWKNNVQFFKNVGFSVPEGYLGKIVEVTGKIKYDNGPEIVVYHPSQIKVVQE